MSNTEHYNYESELKVFIRNADQEKLRTRLQDFVTVAQVDTVRLLGTTLGFRPQGAE